MLVDTKINYIWYAAGLKSTPFIHRTKVYDADTGVVFFRFWVFVVALANDTVYYSKSCEDTQHLGWLLLSFLKNLVIDFSHCNMYCSKNKEHMITLSKRGSAADILSYRKLSSEMDCFQGPCFLCT